MYINFYLLDLKIYNVVIYKYVHTTHGWIYLMYHSHVGADELFTASNRFKYSSSQNYHIENNSLRCHFGVILVSFWYRNI
jgi:hypothetical protein